MFLDKYYNQENDKISFTRLQASDFAKQIADDFNYLHDTDAKRFCVPGDLLFSLVLANSGLSQEMTFVFSGMVSNDIKLTFPKQIQNSAAIIDDAGKEYLRITCQGKCTTDEQAIESLIRSYVEFSGHTFPHILVKLMAENNVMINPDRPMVLYESMSIHLDELDFTEVMLSLSSTTLSIEGKRGNACLSFDLVAAGHVIGHGKKHMLLSGLREYDQQTIDTLVREYNDKKVNYLPNL